MSEAKDLIVKISEAEHPLEGDRDFINARFAVLHSLGTLHQFKNIIEDLPHSKHNTSRTAMQELEWIKSEANKLVENINKMEAKLKLVDTLV